MLVDLLIYMKVCMEASDRILELDDATEMVITNTWPSG